MLEFQVHSDLSKKCKKILMNEFSLSIHDLKNNFLDSQLFLQFMP